MPKILRRALQIVFTVVTLLTIFAVANAAEPLPADQAFQLKGVTTKDNHTLVTHWDVAPEYYLYKDKFGFSIINPAPVKLGQPGFPHTSQSKIYPTGEKMPVFSGNFTITLPLEYKKSISDRIKLEVHYQGCSELGICYPEQAKIVTLSLAGLHPTQITNAEIDPLASSSTDSTPAETADTSEQGKIVQLLHGNEIWPIVIGFFILGLLLSLTPCVLPMIPILSGIIIGQKNITHAKSFALSFVYVLAMALTYAVLGVIVGLVGSSIQAVLQKPWIIILFTLIFVAMALSLFGFYTIQLPERLRHRIASISNHQKHGSYIGTAVMGCLSTLILSPCVTPPLAGAIVYIGDHGNALLGATSLFVMGLGMGVPLLIIGATSAKLLPKAGHWMNTIKSLLGIVMLGVAIWMVARIIPGQASMFLWGALGIGCAITLRTFQGTKGAGQHFMKAIGIIIFIYAIVLIFGSFQGRTNPLKPLDWTQTNSETSHDVLNFIQVKNLKEFKQQLAHAERLNKPVMLDFYASWCVSCKEMDAYTFTDPTVKKLLGQYILLRADVSNNNADNKLLQQHFKVVAPPTILFFTPDGKLLENARIVGEISAEKFIQHLQQMNR